MNNLNQLPDLCLLEVFDRLPLHEVLYKLPLVCRRWHDLAQLSAPARRSSLDISIMPPTMPGAPPTQHNKIKYIPNRDCLPEDCFNWIVNTFPSLTSLSIHFSIVMQAQSLTSFVRFLEHFAPKLVKLDLDLPKKFISPAVFDLINRQMPALRILRISITKLTNIDTDYIILPVVRQLNSFKFLIDKCHYSTVNRAVLCYLETSQHLSCFELQTSEFTDAQNLLSLSPIAARRVTLFEPLEEFATDYQTMNRFCLLYTSLTEFTIDFLPKVDLDEDEYRAHRNAGNLTLSQLLACVRPLTQLKTLNLSLNLKGHSFEDICVTHQLPSVRSLDWSFRLKNHSQLIEAFDFGRTFPQLDSAKIEFCNADQCKKCTTRRGRRYSPDSCLKAICDHIEQSASTVTKARVAGSSRDDGLIGSCEMER